MRPDHVVRARFAGVVPLSGAGGAGLALRFDLLQALQGVGQIEDYADLDPGLTPQTVEGVGKLLRLLRAARIAPPAAPFALVGDAPEAARWATRAIGVAVKLALRRRSTLRFTAWTETGVLELDDVAEVREDDEALWVIRRDSRLPLRLARSEVVRRVTTIERSFEVLAIERDPALGSSLTPGGDARERTRPRRADAGARPRSGSPSAEMRPLPPARSLPADDRNAEDAPMADPVVIPTLPEARAHAGRDLGATAWFEIDQARVDRFAEATGEHHWQYVDPERAARESPSKTTTVPGFLLLSLVPHLLPRLVLIGGWTRAVNAGVDGCAFPRPAPVGSRIRMTGRVHHVRNVPGGGARITFSVAFEVEGASEPACTARVHYAYFR